MGIEMNPHYLLRKTKDALRMTLSILFNNSRSDVKGDLPVNYHVSDQAMWFVQQHCFSIETSIPNPPDEDDAMR